jgi:hypothetical protein
MLIDVVPTVQAGVGIGFPAPMSLGKQGCLPPSRGQCAVATEEQEG